MTVNYPRAHLSFLPVSVPFGPFSLYLESGRIVDQNTPARSWDGSYPVSGPIAPRREPFSPPPHSSPLQSPHRHHLLSSLWQDSLPGPLPHLPTRLSSSRKGPDGSFLHRASSQPHELVDPYPAAGRRTSKCRVDRAAER